MRTNKRMALSAFLLPGGYDKNSWRLTGSRAGELGQFDIIRDITLQYEAAKVDAVFIADVISSKYTLESNVMMGNPYEPMTSLAALSSITERIGLIGTFSTTWNHPFNLARQLAELDILSSGRAGWNIVTSSRAEENFGMPLPDKPTRYRRATEFVDVARELWTAWSDKAIVNDGASGIWVDPELVRQIAHAGEFFNIAGSINIPRSPQGHPVLVQAGQSSGGIELGASRAEVVYTAQPQREKAIEHYAQIKRLAAADGRDPASIKVLPGICPYIGATRSEAHDFRMSMGDFIDYEVARSGFEDRFGIDLSGIDLDEQIPEERFGDLDDDTAGTRFMAYKNLALEDKLSLKEVLLNAESIGGHLIVSGTAEDVADTMIDWFESGACDGFSLNAPSIPASIDQICNKLIPILQERGYARTEYVGETLRDHLELPYPPAWDAASPAAE